jgi:2-polyprenyl-3-methyl-5-hydroxy-6-metoxy-1,4-benzoquinol methylase
MTKDSQFIAYQQNAGVYDAENDHRKRTFEKKVSLITEMMTYSPRKFRKTILEVGCGTGIFTDRLAEILPNASITASDAYPAMLEFARDRLGHRPNVRVVQYDAEEVLSVDHRFDIICGVDLIHHLDNPVKAMTNWLKCVKPGAELLFFESNPRNPILYLRSMNRPEESRFKYNTKRNLVNWLSCSGWAEISVKYIDLYLPNFPRFLWATCNQIERILHYLPPIRMVSGGMLVSARAP